MKRRRFEAIRKPKEQRITIFFLVRMLKVAVEPKVGKKVDFLDGKTLARLTTEHARLTGEQRGTGVRRAEGTLKDKEDGCCSLLHSSGH